MNETEQLQTENQEDTTATHQEDELSMLKDRAKLMGITFSNNIGLKSLRDKVNAAITGDALDPETVATGVNPLASVGAAQEAPLIKMLTLREHMVNEQMKLVRLRIQNLDPKKKDLPGEVICVANEYLGTIKKYIPYGEASENGYHVPFCIYSELESRKFQNLRSITDKATGQIKIDTSWVREFSLEILPALTATELAQLAVAQTAAGK